MSAGAQQSVSRAGTQRGPVIRLLHMGWGEEGRREGGLSYRIVGSILNSAGGEGSHPSLRKALLFFLLLSRNCKGASHVARLSQSPADLPFLSWSTPLFLQVVSFGCFETTSLEVPIIIKLHSVL